MTKSSKLLYLLLGIPLYVISFLIPRNKKLIVFGGGNGEYYSDNSKFLFEYYLDHSDKQCLWLTRNEEVFQTLKGEGKPVCLNTHILGLIKVLRAGTVVFCTSRIDILYIFKKRNRKIYNLFHAMPLKKIIYDYDGKDLKRGHLFDRLWNTFVAGFTWEDSKITFSTSDIFNPVLTSAFRTENIKVTGLPRNDFFFINNTIANKKFNSLVLNNKIISYLPTHRKFGVGNQPITPFTTDEDFQTYLNSSKSVLIHKPHYNVKGPANERVGSIYEFGPGDLDVQELLKNTDILITDYSSCYIDYLLLNRPVIFYRYDNYTEDDTGVYSEIEKLTKQIGPICTTESELKDAIREFVEGNDTFLKSRTNALNIMHHHHDGGYSQKVFEYIEND